ncbi:hypothetical protein [Microbacterium terrisoli]|uniref:hypothetical protein n=1 Tax=Microbacterium terrisoli TaxID=3242192 RepID=UPI0028051358|nr:hypothetical protein [Microbacterium protaetiae]
MARLPLSLTNTDERTTITGASYALTWSTGPRGVVRSPYLELRDRRGDRWTRLCVLSSVHTTQSPDETTSIDEPAVTRDGDDVVVRVRTSSSHWAARTLEVRCTPDAIELTLVAVGSGDLTDVTVAGGDGILPTGASGTFRSSIDAASLYVPTPTEPVAFMRPATQAASLGVVGDADPGRVHGIFSPPPLTLAWSRAAAEGPLDPPDGPWLAISLRAPVDQLRFTALRYEPLDGGFLLRLPYEGHTVVDDTWSSPTVVLRPVDGAHHALTAFRDDLVAHGLAPSHGPHVEPWWRQPLFCGWGAQVARGGAPAPDLCTQELYDEFLEILHTAGLAPGTIVVDDRWQHEYGTAEPDPQAWPDLRGWIAQQHAGDRRVLLWWKAWDPAGLPAEECVTDAAGRPIAADPGSPAYRARLRAIVARLIGPDGLDADGFKVDFTQRAPSGRTLRTAPDSDGVWGIAALHRLVAEIHGAAKAAKPDALVVTHTVHPSFGDVTDMVRTNDVLERDTTGEPVPAALQLTARHAIVSGVLPHHPIDTDQWPMPSRAQWLDYTRLQPTLGVPALYYLERVREDEAITADDLAEVRASWDDYRKALG